MGLRVNNNIAALNAYRNLSVTDGQMSKSLEKLSSGFRINRAADDAAGLAISEGLRSQIGGLKVAVRNTQDGISVVQTAEGALTETHSILQRMRDLSVQAANTGGLNTDAKANIQSEIGQLKSELNRIADRHHVQRQEAARRQLPGHVPGGRQLRRDHLGGHRSVGAGMDAAGLGVSGVDVTGVGAYTAGAAGAGKVSTVNAGAATAVLTITATVDGDYLDATDAVAASFEKLAGTINFGGKSFDLGSVDYSNTTTGAPALDRAEHGRQVRPGPDDQPVHRRHRHRADVQVDDAVTGFTGAAGARSRAAGRRPRSRSPPPPRRSPRPAARRRRSTSSTPRSRRSPPRAPTWVPSRTGSTTPSTTSTSRWRT